jgi:hypothetical protein
MAFRKNAPTRAVWFICLGLYLLALLSHFDVFRVRADITTWSWILGYALLLVATQMKRV